MNLFFEGINLINFLGIIILLVALLFLNEVTRKSLKMSILIFMILPVVLAIGVYLDFLGSPTGNTWFGWVKVISALAGVYGFMIIRFTNIGNSKFAGIFPVSILAINILEAVYREFEVFFTYKELTTDAGGILIQGGIWNIFNGIAGILCIITLTGFLGIRVSKDKSKDMIWPDMTWLYIIGYTLWNFAYVYNCISTRSMYAGLILLTAPLIAEFFIKRGAWLQHRAQTLSMYAMFSLSIDFQSYSLFNILPTYNKNLLTGFSLLSLVFNIFVFGCMIYTIKKYRKNPLKEEIYTHTNYYKKTISENNL